MSSVRTRSQSQRAMNTAEESLVQDSGVPASESDVARHPVVFSQPPLSPSEMARASIATVIDAQRNTARSTTSTKRSSASHARARLAEAEYECARRIAEAERAALAAARTTATAERALAEKKLASEQAAIEALLDGHSCASSRAVSPAPERDEREPPLPYTQRRRPTQENPLPAPETGCWWRDEEEPPLPYTQWRHHAQENPPPPPEPGCGGRDEQEPPLPYTQRRHCTSENALPAPEPGCGGRDEEGRRRGLDPPPPPLAGLRGGDALEGRRQANHADPIDRLAASMERLVSRPLHTALPPFNGDPDEWLNFANTYTRTNASHRYTPEENMSRLQAALRGDARKLVAGRLFYAGDPASVMKTLTRRYGHPGTIVSAEVQKVRDLPLLKDNGDLHTFASCIESCVSTLKSLRHVGYLHSPELIAAIKSKLPLFLRYKLRDHAALRGYEHTGTPELETLSEFLCAEADKALDVDGPPPRPTTTPQAGNARTQRTPAQTHRGGGATAHRTNCATQEESHDAPAQCDICKKSHSIAECADFAALSADERWEAVIKLRRCFRCLKGRHQWKACKARACNKCGGPHHRLLHQENKRAKQDHPPSAPTKSSAAGGAQSEYAASVGTCCTTTARFAYLKIAPVVLKGPAGEVEAFALLDEGSTITMLEMDTAARVGADGPNEPLRVHGVGGQMPGTNASKRVALEIRGRGSNTWQKLTDARTVQNIGLGAHTIDADVLRGCEHLRELRDALVYAEAKPTLLIGQDNWGLIVTRELRAGKKNQPVASRTDLGWVLHGYKPATGVVGFTTCHTRVVEPSGELERIVEEHFSLESLGVAPRQPRIPSEERALAILQATKKKLRNGRYEVGLLWREDNIEMPPSEHQALTRLRSMEKKMAADEHFKRQYKEKMKTLLDSGYAERCPPGPPGHPVWYLPHFAVKNPNKPGKLRIVHDAAARVGGTSLNDKLLAGPDYLQSLLGVLMRFREGAVAVTGDIREMFMRVMVREEDRDAQRFLWRDNPDEPPVHYRMTSLIFGAASSPASALFIKNENARSCAPDKHIIEIIERDHYMDDAIHSTQSTEEAARAVRNVTEVHASAGFEIRGWASNKPAALRDIAQEQRSTGAVDFSAHDSALEKTLGLIWRPDSDMLAFNLSLHRVPRRVADGTEKPTKREMLSLVMSIFDPLGLLTPITTHAKALLQQVWRSGIGWDDKLSDDDHAAWTEWLKNLGELKSMRIPRYYGGAGEDAAELHVFCDASSTAYAAVAYWRYTSQQSERAATTLIASKSRVAPLRPASIPRLELQATVLGARLAETIMREHRTRAASVTYWCDSRTALSWIRTDGRRYKPFVAHRVAEVQELTRPDQWRWVPTKMNPADLATRAPPADFGAHHWWYTGPEFLTRHEGEWPSEIDASDINVPTDNEELKKVHVATHEEPHPALPSVQRFSKWTRLVRSTARVLQFIDLARTARNPGAARSTTQSADPAQTAVAAIISKKKARKPAGIDIRLARTNIIPLEEKYKKKAELLWTRAAQKDSFGQEIKHIEERTQLKSSKLAALAPTIDDSGVLRVGGRINAASGLHDDTKTPVILHGDHPYTRLLIRHYHEKMQHANYATVMNEIRQRYWVLKLRTTLRAAARACRWCRVRRDTPRLPPPGDLPSARLDHHQRAFTSTGVDYFGPMEVAVGRRREKRWGALFTCLTTRAVHVELVASLSADSMILALRRMTARRGTPTTIWSDNGTNFVGANRQLMGAQEELKQLGAAAENMGINWHFIPPGAPNMGGAWERLVRSVKTALAATLRERAPREEVLATLLAEAEHIVNSRPLTYVSTNHEEEEALTPNHFLLGASSGAPVPAYTTDRDLVGHATWRTAQRLADHFWSRWLREYLPTLVPRGRAGRPERDLVIGDVVLIVDQTLPRNTWPRGQVQDVFPGPDGRVRVVNVRTAAGVLRRPVQRLVLLPTEDAEESPKEE